LAEIFGGYSLFLFSGGRLDFIGFDELPQLDELPPALASGLFEYQEKGFSRI
jgi:hypothetical protein